MNWTYLRGEGVVVVLPRELGLDVAAGVEGLAGLDHVEVLGVNFAVLGKVEVLLSHEHTLCINGLQSALIISSRNIHSAPECPPSRESRSHTTEEVLVDLLAVFLGDKPGMMLAKLFNPIGISGAFLTLSRVPGALRGIALTTREEVG